MQTLNLHVCWVAVSCPATVCSPARVTVYNPAEQRFKRRHMQMMGVDRLRLGRQQPFFHCLVDERDRPGAVTTYVAQVLVTNAALLEAVDASQAVFRGLMRGLGC